MSFSLSVLSGMFLMTTKPWPGSRMVQTDVDQNAPAELALRPN